MKLVLVPVAAAFLIALLAACEPRGPKPKVVDLTYERSMTL